MKSTNVMNSNLTNTEYLNSDNLEFLQHLVTNCPQDWNEVCKELASEDDKFIGFPKLPQSAMICYSNDNTEDIKIAYRKYAYRYANLNPLYPVKNDASFLSDMGLNSENKDVIARMNSYYLGTRSAEFDFVFDKKKRDWLITNFEKDFQLFHEEKTSTLWHLMEAEGLEKFIHKKFPGAKRFSIEGAESSIPIFETILWNVANSGCEEIVLGMAHRGRLNFLTKVCGEPYSFVFGQFAGKNAFDESLGISGDVKYHLGASHDRILFNNKNVHISLLPNPSHLEAVYPVVIGNVRARQDDKNDKNRNKIIPFVIHGDASFAGQGVVYETFAMNNLPAYDVGGCIHLIIDNQVGFTADNVETRSTTYSSALAKFIEAPIFHVNGDDPEACVFVSKLVAEYRMKFGGEVVINLVCYRRYGHNEGDEPAFTQPTMYKLINARATTFRLYADKLINEKILSQSDLDKKVVEFHNFLDLENEKFEPKREKDLLVGRWADFKFNFNDTIINCVTTGIKIELISKVINCLADIPTSVTPNSKIKKLLDERIKRLKGEEGIDWGTAEMLGFASLLNEGTNIRISGEDVLRGTFAHRHAAIIDQKNDSRYFYYKSLGDATAARFDVYNSILSEYAVMGFDYGYSLYSPKNLVIWEGQFGDFANGAQIILDQYLSGAEQKWGRMSNLVLMLPHGYEGQGPEHSSARIERFLQLCGEYNMRVIQPTTPANIFHSLRRQIHDADRKPLVIFTPKSLLRNKLAISSLDEFFNNSSFEEILTFGDIQNTQKLILCTGKIYYELYEKIISEEIKGVFIIRIEQLYPFPLDKILQIVHSLIENSALKSIIWCQDEPKNMGAYHFVYQQLNEFLYESNIKMIYHGRATAAATAGGSNYNHNKEQKELIENCLV